MEKDGQKYLDDDDIPFEWDHSASEQVNMPDFDDIPPMDFDDINRFFDEANDVAPYIGYSSPEQPFNDQPDDFPSNEVPAISVAEILEGLNNQQKDAVSLPIMAGATMVLAGAGTGKTSVLTKRIAYLVSQGVNPQAILAVTFTNKAAREMKERLIKLGIPIPPMGTFHQIGMRILKICPYAAGVKRGFTPSDSTDSEAMWKKLFLAPTGHVIQPNEMLFYRNDKQNWGVYMKTMFKLKEMGVEEAAKIQHGDLPPEVDAHSMGRILNQYEIERKKCNKVDFADMIWASLFAIKETHDGQIWASRFTHVLVDEFQDTSRLQFEWATSILARQYPNKADQNLFCVGDDCQSIYAFRGAVVNNINRFIHDYKAETVMLEQNYRCKSLILKAANNLIRNNKDGDRKKLWSVQPDGLVEYQAFADDRLEAAAVAASLAAKSPKEWEDCAILSRTKAALIPITKALRASRIAHHIVGATDYFNSAAIRDAMSLARFAGNHADAISFIRAASLVKGIGKKAIESVIDAYDETGEPILVLCRNNSKMAKIAALFDGINNESNPAPALRHMINEAGLYEIYQDEEANVKNLTELIEIAGQFKSVQEFLEDVTISTERADEKAGVTLSTIHSAKGLEWGSVYLPALSEGHLPMLNNEEGGIAEERRLMYVAITRAKHELHTSFARSRMTFGSFQDGQVSQFVTEAGLVPTLSSAPWKKPTHDNNKDGVNVLDEAETEDCHPIAAQKMYC